MAKKEFTYRGKTVADMQGLSETEFMKLITARERRTIKRGYNPSGKLTLLKIQKKKVAKTRSREVVITPNMIGKTISVHRGNSYTELSIFEDMIGHRLGEFVMCNKKVTHGKAGLGSTGGSKTETRK
ncbi:MAG: ribosomal protein S19 family protein [Candidatus Woesearchaeota archaeon]|jgi:small subunit ribosomal protein S19